MAISVTLTKGSLLVIWGASDLTVGRYAGCYALFNAMAAKSLHISEGTVGV
jgi:hypothetical protein